MDAYIDHDAYTEHMPEDGNKVSLPEGEAYEMRLHPTHPLSNTNKTYSSIGPPSLSSKNILNLSGSWQSVRNLANEIYTRPELKEQFSATRYEIDWDTDEEEDEEDEEESANLFRQYRPRLIDPQSKPPSFTSSTLDPSLYPWRQFPIPPYHPGYMGNGYPPGVPTIPLPMPVPTPAPAPVNGNTGSAISPIPRLSRSKSCKKHRKARKRCNCHNKGNINPRRRG